MCNVLYSVVPPRPAEEEEVTQFHSKDYIEFLQRINQQDDEEKIDPADAEQYGLSKNSCQGVW